MEVKSYNDKDLEIWKDVELFHNKYEISNKGRLRSKERFVASSIQKLGFRKLKSKIKPPQNNGKGYLQFYVQIENKRFLEYVHRLVAIAFIPNPENKPEVNHKDGDKANNNDWNLEWSTKIENMEHASINDFMSKGEKHPSSKLTVVNVMALRRLYKLNPGFNKTIVAKKLGVKDSTIHKIINNQSWKHLN